MRSRSGAQARASKAGATRAYPAASRAAAADSPPPAGIRDGEVRDDASPAVGSARQADERAVASDEAAFEERARLVGEIGRPREIGRDDAAEPDRPAVGEDEVEPVVDAGDPDRPVGRPAGRQGRRGRGEQGRRAQDGRRARRAEADDGSKKTVRGRKSRLDALPVRGAVVQPAPGRRRLSR